MNFNKVCSEVYGFICSLSIEEYYKIPEDEINFYKLNRDYNYKVKYDVFKPLEELKMLSETKIIILKLFMDYFANEEEKEYINTILRKNEDIFQKELSKKYNLKIF